jgi:hypothetical protein
VDLHLPTRKGYIVRISRKTGAMTGFMLIVLGLWGGLIPLIGPYFGYAFGSHATWDLTMNRFWLDVLPGAAVVLGGLMLIWSGHRMSGTVASWMAMTGGAWFAVGPAVSRLWEHGPGPIGVPLFGHTRQTFELIGYFYGLGIVVMGLAAFALGRFVSRPALAQEPAMAMDEPLAAEPEQLVMQPVAAEPVTAAQPAVSEPVVPRRPITGTPAPADSTASRREEVPTV